MAWKYGPAIAVVTLEHDYKNDEFVPGQWKNKL